MPIWNFPTITRRECGSSSDSGSSGGGSSSDVICCGLVVANTVEELRAITPITGIKAALLLGVDEQGDSSMIAYTWVADSLDDDDGIQTIKFDVTDSASPGRLKQEGFAAP